MLLWNKFNISLFKGQEKGKTKYNADLFPVNVLLKYKYNTDLRISQEIERFRNMITIYSTSGMFYIRKYF